jgi:hypothetical protein
VRTRPDVATEYKRQQPNDGRFKDFVGVVQAIATSGAQNDAGVFELSFHDERYLPFEGQGVISRWQLELSQETNTFDVSTITDVILHMRYTARDGGQTLRDHVLNEVVRPAPREGAVLLSMKQQFSSAWYSFLHPTGPDQTLSFEVTEKLFPFVTRGKTLRLTRADIFLLLRDPQTYSNYSSATTPLIFHLGPAGSEPGDPLTLKDDPSYANVPHGFVTPASRQLGAWHLKALESEIAPTALNLDVNDATGTARNRIDPDLVTDALIVLQFQAN